VLARVAEYLEAGVTAVVVLDVEPASAQVFTIEGNQILGADDELTLPAILPGFSVAVREFFA
jgi:hypothetical protein